MTCLVKKKEDMASVENECKRWKIEETCKRKHEQDIEHNLNVEIEKKKESPNKNDKKHNGSKKNGAEM